MDIILASQRPPSKQLLGSQRESRLKLVTPGEVISEDLNFMRGHGTYMENGKLLASTAGYLTRVNRLLTVTPLRQVYQGAVGDTIVGRITQVQSNRWKVDANSRLDAELRLAHIQLPGGEQRRKDFNDERGMRGLLKEGDLICLEVQKINDDGLLRLTARTTKFGKLSQGVLMKVSPSLIVQDKQRMHDLPCGARVIFGANGYIFISPTIAEQTSSYVGNIEERHLPGNANTQLRWIIKYDLETEILNQSACEILTDIAESRLDYNLFSLVASDVRKIMSRLRNAIQILAHHSIMISPTSVMICFDASIEMEYEIKDLLKPELMEELALTTIQKVND